MWAVHLALLSLTEAFPLPLNSWTIHEPASASLDSILLSSGHVSSTHNFSYSDFCVVVELRSVCVEQTDGVVLALTEREVQTGSWFGLQTAFNGIAVVTLFAAQQVTLYTNTPENGLQEIHKCMLRSNDRGIKIYVERRNQRIFVLLGDDKESCGELNLQLTAFHVTVSGNSAACSTSLSNLEVKDESLLSQLSALSAEIQDVNAYLQPHASTNVDFVLSALSRQMDDLHRDIRRLKDSFAIQLKRNEWMVNSLSHELEDKHKMLEFELNDLTRRVDKGELADRIGRWVEIFSRRTLTTEPELTQTLRDIREWSEKVDTHVSKDDKFTWIYVLLLGLFGAAVLVCRQVNVVTKRVKTH